MSYKTKFNPFTKKLQWVLDELSIQGLTFKDGVATYNDLPITGNSKNDSRITNDTHHLYIWDTEESSGTLTNWIDQGDIIDIAWDSITGKPSSTPAQIDDAVSKRHTKALSGTVAPTLVTPEYIGQLYTNTTDDKIYIAKSLSQGDWEEISTNHEHTKTIVTVGVSGADYDNFNDAIDYLRAINGGTIIIISDMTITSTAIKDITNITFRGNMFYSGSRKINKNVNGGYWYGKNVRFEDLWFYRLSDAGANEIFRYTENYQEVNLHWVNCIGLGSMSSPAVFNCNGKEAHIIAERKCVLGAEAMSYVAFSNSSTLVANLFESSFLYIPGTIDAVWYDASSGITGNPTYNTPNHPVLMDKVSGIDNDSSVTGNTVKDALENLEALTNVNSLNIKQPVRLVDDTDYFGTPEDLDLSGLIDGILPNEGDRILVIGMESAGKQYCGIWIASATGWYRATDFDSNEDIKSGVVVFCTDGNYYGGDGFILKTPDPIILETTELEFEKTTGAGQLVQYGGININKINNEISVKVDDTTIEINEGDNLQVKDTNDILNKGIISEENGDYKKVTKIQYNPITGDIKIEYEQ